MNLEESIKDRMADYLALGIKHNVRSLYAYGSSIKEDFNEDSSDIDILIEVDNSDPIVRVERLLKLCDKL